MKSERMIPLVGWPTFSSDAMYRRSAQLREYLELRRTVREFSDKPVPRDIIEQCLMTASSAPSGANMQPWHFEAVSNPDVKRQIREAAEAEEREFYAGRASDEWLEALEKARVQPAFRSLRLCVQDFQWSLESGALALQFALGRGAFATAVLREIATTG